MHNVNDYGPDSIVQNHAELFEELLEVNALLAEKIGEQLILVLAEVNHERAAAAHQRDGAGREPDDRRPAAQRPRSLLPNRQRVGTQSVRGRELCLGAPPGEHRRR